MLLMTIPDFSNPGVWISLLTLTFLEIVLGVDNIIFISIVANKLPASLQPKARNIGLTLALVMRVALLFGITWIMQLKEPVFELSFMEDPKEVGKALAISWKDVILIVGGISLLTKSTLEIHHKLEQATKPLSAKGSATFGMVILQIVLVDAIFSVDSILTAIGLVDNVIIMIIAVVISMGVMMAFAGPISRFINQHPSLQVLALAFLIAIGIILIANGFHQDFNKGYIYTALAFSLVVELINMRLRRSRQETVESNDAS
ncbi:MAG: TerC family protein [Bacteroidetes bacterium]|nr:TerC family protein [Bacteroidota bacterium]